MENGGKRRQRQYTHLSFQPLSVTHTHDYRCATRHDRGNYSHEDKGAGQRYMDILEDMLQPAATEMCY